MFELVFMRQGRKLLCKTVSGETISIGRAPDNSICLPDEEVSRRHCKIEMKDGGLSVTDLSLNGTLINGRPGKAAVLKKDDTLQIGPWTVLIGVTHGNELPRTVVATQNPTKVIVYNPTGKKLTTERIDLTITSPNGSKKDVRRPASETTFGTHPSCDIVVTDEFASRKHCMLSFDGGSLRLQDMNSTNGTFIGESKISEMKLSQKGSFRFGKTIVEYSLAKTSEKLKISKDERLGPIIGPSKQMREIFALIEKVAASNAIICITGESGTGKELVAREIHSLSDRKRGPFVAVNCGAVPASLIESHLFGHERGAFTGAAERSAGLFEQASGGTIFLDEIGEMPPDLQTRLLRVLETGTVRRIGGNREIAINTRVVCATNRDLKRLVSEGGFRKDLFFRLFVVPILLPPLRERASDIPLLARHFVAEMAPKDRNLKLADSAISALKKYEWPGNVRELKNTIERTLLLSSKDVIEADDLKLLPMGIAASERLNLKENERQALVSAVEECRGNLSKAAKKLGIARTTLQAKVKKFSIRFSGRG